MEISNRCSESSVRIAMVLSSDFAEKSLPLSILNTEDSSNFSLDVPSVANAGMHKLITIAQERMRDKNLFNAFILASFLRSNNY